MNYILEKRSIINGYKNHFAPVISHSFLNKNIIKKDIFKNCSIIDTKILLNNLFY